jgi:RNA polymerase sigma factor (sigma-70 family)
MKNPLQPKPQEPLERHKQALLAAVKQKLHERVCKRMGVSHSDILQSALLSFSQKPTSASKEPSLSNDPLLTTLFEIIRKHCDKWNKRARAQKAQVGLLSLDAPVGRDIGPIEIPSDEPGPIEITMCDNLTDKLMELLTDRQQAILQMRLHGFNKSAIGEQLNMPEATVRNELKRIGQVMNRLMGDLDELQSTSLVP